MGSVANLVVVSWQLSVRTTSVMSLETTYLPLLWAFLAVVVHFMGAGAVWLRLRLSNTAPGIDNPDRPYILEVLRREFQLSGSHDGTKLEYKKESYWFVALSWSTSLGTVLHIIFGTLMFSSTIFISTRDALYVSAQYLGSTLVCRMILMFEISGLRTVVEVGETEYKDRTDEEETLVPVQGKHDNNDNDQFIHGGARFFSLAASSSWVM
ncbi:hypothetical protein LTR08_004831 [Meristemomyces frigidus]|nr:hypothetical protein LTR08_004831 [Meristemomyces frigidus]